MVNLFQHIDELIRQGIDPQQQEDDIRRRYGQRVAVMVLDSSGFSRVSESHGILHFLTKLVLMRKIVEPVLTSHPNLSYKFEADNIWAVFEDVDVAISAALAMHQVLNEQELMLTETEPFRVCIGVGFGDLLYSETLEGYFGEEMNLASKLGEDAADGDQTLLTQKAYEAADPTLVSDFEVAELSIAGISTTYYHHRMLR